jgi:YebC/PmpR family DNA-binding regulatory protein
MSGHSKWSQIKRQKGAADVKRGKVFTKLANAIIITVREGKSGDPSANFKLRLAIEQARAANMPKDNIQKAIDRAQGRGEAGQLEEVAYEGYGPFGVAVMVQAATDSKNRTTSEIKNILERSGGSLGGPNSVSWMFENQGLVNVKKEGKNADEIILAAADFGAEDAQEAGELVEIYTQPDNVEKVKEDLEKAGYKIESFEVLQKPKNLVQVTEEGKASQVLQFIDKLDNLDDVVKVSANFEIPDEILGKIGQ